MKPLRVALLSSCTIEMLRSPLAAALAARGFEASFWTAGFGQYRQAILDPSSALWEFAPHAIILYLDGEDLFREFLENPYEPNAARRGELAAAQLAELASLVRALAERLPQTAVLINSVAAPPLNALTGLEYNSDYSLVEVFGAYNRGLAPIAHENRAVTVVDAAALAAAMGYDNWRDARLWYLARARWSRRAIESLAARYATVLASRLGPVRKCIVLDLDNTLWGGIAGEDGLAGIRLGEEGVGRAFAEFQLELLNLYRKGILLAICSKNNPADALEIIRTHPSMRLREEHFAAVRINWDDKAANLSSLAEELNIGRDSLVFVDDNPAERAWVRQAIPEILVPEWPTDPSDYKTALLELAASHFHKLAITDEDRRRGDLYQAQSERRKLGAAAGSLEDYYRALAMRIKIGRARAFTIPRIAQLTNKTNQFNLTTRRYTEADIALFAACPRHLVFWMELDDRFGTSGIVGVLILERMAEADWVIDTFLLSCRALGRTAETAFLAAVCRFLKTLGARRLVGEYIPTPKNPLAAQFYPCAGFRALELARAGQCWELDLEQQTIPIPEWFAITFDQEETPSAR